MHSKLWSYVDGIVVSEQYEEVFNIYKKIYEIAMVIFYIMRKKFKILRYTSIFDKSKSSLFDVL